MHRCRDGAHVQDESECSEPDIKCWDGTHAFTQSECPELVCNIDTYFALPPCENGERNFRNCSCPWEQCPDGVWVADLSDCEVPAVPDVVCWDGSLAFSYFECPLPDIFCTDDCPEIPTFACWNNVYVVNETDCPPEPTFECWNGQYALSESDCPARPVYQCWDGERVFDLENCRERPTFVCWDGEIVNDLDQCRS